MGISANVRLSDSIADTVLLDNFTGSGALSAHTPDTAPVGSSWSVINGTFGDLSGGYLPYGSGASGLAIIDCGLADCEITFRLKYFNVGDLCSSIAFRCNSAGSDKYTVGLLSSGGNSWISTGYSGVPGGVQLPPGYSIFGNRYSMTAGEYYTFRMYMSGALFRVTDEAGGILIAANSAAKLTQTYVGVSVFQPYGGWDSIEVKSFTHRIHYFGVIGDSMSNEPGEWPGIVSAFRLNGFSYPNNYSVSGSTVVNQMAGQAASVVAANPTCTLIQLGTNDGWPSATFQTKYYDGLMALQAGMPGKPIYAMGVFPKTSDSDRAGKNAAIQAAVASAVSAGANVQYWDTDYWISPATDTDDGLHPNATGQNKIAGEILARF